MTRKQQALYWRAWAAAKRAGRLEDADRHRLHAQTLGRDKSSADFTNADLDRILATFRAISAPADLNAQLRQQQQPRTRILWWIDHNCLQAYAADLSRDRFGTADFRSLPFDQLQQLHMTLKNRPRSRIPSEPAPAFGVRQPSGAFPMPL